MYISYSLYFELNKKQAKIIEKDLEEVIPNFAPYLNYSSKELEKDLISFKIEFDNKKDWESFLNYLEKFSNKKI